MGAASADRQGTAHQMPNPSFQGFFLGSVVDGLRCCQLGNVDIAHCPGSCQIKKRMIRFGGRYHGIFRVTAKLNGAVPQRFIIGGCSCPGFWNRLIRKRLNSIPIFCMNLRLMLGNVSIAEHRIDGQSQCDQERDCRHGNGHIPFSSFSDRIASFRGTPRRNPPGCQILTGHASSWMSQQ